MGSLADVDSASRARPGAPRNAQHVLEASAAAHHAEVMCGAMAAARAVRLEHADGLCVVLDHALGDAGATLGPAQAQSCTLPQRSVHREHPYVV